MIHCPICSSNVSPSSRYCSECGSLVATEIDPTQTSAPEQERCASSPARSPAGSGASLGVGRLSTSDSQGASGFVPGTLVAGRYRIIGLLGKGGMGEVYRADDLKLDQPVALKFLPSLLEDHPGRLARFLNEVKIARQIAHPNVCRVYDIGQIEDRHFISMEFVDGEDLSSLLHRIGRLPNDKAIEIARQICAGLAAAHAKGIVHRDLKPANIMLDGEGKVRITDFGLAGVAEGIAGDEVRVGTPDYMAPEQISGKQVSLASDIYSLGLVLYELFTGKRTFSATTRSDLERLQSEVSPASPSSLVGGIDPAVERVILHCLEKNPQQRPASVYAAAAALPGGDPLSAALAAGETPSPQMVADAGAIGGLRPAVAGISLLLFLIGIAAIALIGSKVSLLSHVALVKPPEALVVESREIISRFGYTEEPADSAFGFLTFGSYIEHIEDNDQSSERWEQLAKARPGPIAFWYRESPRPLVTQNFSDDVTFNFPRMRFSGMVRVLLDPQGRLIQFYAIPPQRDESIPDGSGPEWSILFEEAGLDISAFTEVEPQWTPLVTSDARAAWEGSFPGQPEIPTRIEAGAYRGKPVYFQIVMPWSRPGRMQRAEQSLAERSVNIVLLVLLCLILLVAGFIAWRNLSLGRVDRRGAFRLALYMFSIAVLAWALDSHHVMSLAEEVGQLFFDGIQFGLLIGAMVWLVYIALEPYARRIWPHALISWTRLLAGRLRDPLVGRDILLGGLAGISVALLLMLDHALPGWTGRPPESPIGVVLNALEGLPNAISLPFAYQATGALFIPIALFFLLTVMRAIFRNEKLAVGVAFVIMAGLRILQSLDQPTEIALSLVIWAVVLFVLVRLGLLASVLTFLCGNLLVRLPYAEDLSVWYAGRGFIVLLMVVGLVFYGFYISLAGRTLFRLGLLDDTTAASK